MGLTKWALTVALIALSFEARAQTKLTYTAPEDCPTEETFRSAVESRQRVKGIASVTISIVITKEKIGYVAKMTTTDAEGVEAARGMRGDTCPEVVQATALLAALALDIATVPPPPRPPPPPPPPKPLPPPPPPPEYEMALIGGAELRGGLGNGPRPGLVLGGDFASTWRSPLAPSIRSAVFAGFGGESIPSHSVSLTIVGLRFTGALVRFRPVRAFEFRPTFSVEVGPTFAGADTGENAVRAWLAFDLGWTAIVNVTKRWFVELDGSWLFPAFKWRYYFDPNVTAFETPSFTGRMTLMVGIRLGEIP